MIIDEKDMMKKDKNTEQAFQDAITFAIERRKEFLTPEMLLIYILMQDEGTNLVERYHSAMSDVCEELLKAAERVECVPESIKDYHLIVSQQLLVVIDESEKNAMNAGRVQLELPHVLFAILDLPDSFAKYILCKYTTSDKAELLSSIVDIYNSDLDDLDMYFDDDMDDMNDTDEKIEKEENWRKLVTCVNDMLKDHNPLIGREEELDRTIQVLCRREKNNPLHVGEPGVGKTALVYGLAARIESGNVPDRLKGARIYQMDMGSMVAGTSYRGDFEKRIKSVMEGVTEEGNAIVYIDEIHTLIGSGTGGDGSLDGANMLKPYLENGVVRFIGSTTYQEYNRFIQQKRGLVRRFQQIDIPEPSVDETIAILEGLKEKYESYHKVKFADGVLRYAVEASAKHINDRFLPDKAIDLIDEAGAYRELHPLMRKYKQEMRKAGKQTVDKELINDVLARICKIDPKSLHEEDSQNLESLDARISAQIYGQDKAVRQVVEAVQMGKAGLLEEGKPIASLLFVGPTGVGKTEVCKVLAKELGIELVRFDMSEYTEKHTVAKLIGSPAGYVGYEDGGLLTDAIRKTPNCVLLLDEIEKAHSDIYNIMLQVMDYARLTDNKGQKADFRHVILIMTSNAGAQYAHQASVGFGSSVSSGEAMLSTVKKTFKPEFLARLSGTVVFNDMDRTMASLILDKKLRQLSARLASRKVTMELTDDAREMLLDKGYTRKNGAREMDRVINQMVSPMLMREILFGKLKKNGGNVIIDRNDNGLFIR